jgi:hypothetical protein
MRRAHAPIEERPACEHHQSRYATLDARGIVGLYIRQYTSHTSITTTYRLARLSIRIEGVRGAHTSLRIVRRIPSHVRHSRTDTSRCSLRIRSRLTVATVYTDCAVLSLSHHLRTRPLPLAHLPAHLHSSASDAPLSVDLSIRRAHVSTIGGGRGARNLAVRGAQRG